MSFEWKYPCCCCEGLCLGSRDCPAANNEEEFEKRCQTLIDKEFPLLPRRFQAALDSLNRLPEGERLTLSVQIEL